MSLWEVGPVLETIDPKIGQLFDQDPSFIIILHSTNDKLQCDSLQWMAKYVLCTHNVNPGLAHCDNGQLLIEYMKNVGGGCASSMGRMGRHYVRK